MTRALDSAPVEARSTSLLEVDRGRDGRARRGLILALPGALVVGVLALILAGTLTRAFAPTILLDPGSLVRWGLPIATLFQELGAAVTVGGLVLGCGVLRPGRALRASFLAAGIAGCVWAVGSLARLVLTAGDVLGIPLRNADFGEQLGYFSLHIGAGQTWLTVTIIACLVATLAFGVSTPTGAAWTTALAIVAFAVQSTQGHASASNDHDLAGTAIFLHVLGAAVWIGGLVVLALLWWRRSLERDELPAAVGRYSVIAGAAFALVGVSGVENAVIRLPSLSDVFTSYGILILIKIGLFCVLGAFGFSHRRWVLDRLGGVMARGGPDVGMRRAASRLFWRLAGVEVMVMAAVSGVAVALASSAPPEDAVPPPLTPAVTVTGHTLPPPLTFSRYFTQWDIDALFSFLAVAGLVAYLVWARRLRRRGDSWSVWRTVSWCFGMVGFFWVTNSGPAAYGHVLFSAHMLEHMLLTTVFPIFMVCGAPVTLALRALPVRKDDTRGPREWIMLLVHSRVGQFLAKPAVAAVNFAGSMLVFYYTPAFEFALHTSIGHILMVVHFSLAGYLFANALIGIDPGPSRFGYPQRLMLLIATMAFHAFFGVALMMSDTLLVAQWFGLLGRPWGPSAIVDQQDGGGVMWGVGELPTLLLSVIVATRWADSDARTARRKDRQADRDGDAELTEYNAMLEELSHQRER